MENRASYFLIGLFVLVSTAGLFGVAVWFAKVEIDQEFRHYDIYFEGSVAGLGNGGDVRYRGIRVGTVTAIGVDNEDPTRVRVTVQLGAETPIREGDQASLQLQGITGVSFVNIEGAGANSPLLASVDGKRPVIPSTPSAMDRIVAGAPEMLAHAVDVMERFSAMLSAENQANITGILNDIHVMTSSFSRREEQIGRVIDTIDSFSSELNTTAESVRAIAVRTDTLIDEASRTLRSYRALATTTDDVVDTEVRGLLSDLRDTSTELEQMTHQVNLMLQDNREPLRNFSGDGLNQFTSFLNEASFLVGSMTRLIERLESEGARFLIGTQQSEYTVGQ